MKQIFTEDEVANIISIVGDMITCNGDDYAKGYKMICDSAINDTLASHMIAVIQNQRNCLIRERKISLFKVMKNY